MAKLKKHQVKVLLKDGIEAKQVKSILEALGENVDNSYRYNDHRFIYFNEEYRQWRMAYGLYPCAVVSLKELIILLSKEAAEKPSILSGLCAIQVNNEREFKLLMEHYEAKGWKWSSNESPFEVTYKGFGESASTALTYEDRFSWYSNSYKLIPFADFAAEVGIKSPVFVMKSEDGVPLYIGDPYYKALKLVNGWELSAGTSHFTTNDRGNPVRHIESKAFSTKEAAEKWIEEQNKPKAVEVKLYCKKTANIHQDGTIRVFDGSNTMNLFPSDLEDMLHAYKSLQ
ncbi:hypothetical protein [Pedobacter nyackensis]|uniref:Uncharacterized protein n=1 Tax=Pedobacter nyackensis TaxID=475255 RepID=A0A1W1ZX62_9SPHI|nr:hypothetical protein [Pedobacter nyackensis]SMC52926.1 hypothetical protein SAMN04488101_101116 [Pedobacter nyackensis]